MVRFNDSAAKFVLTSRAFEQTVSKAAENSKVQRVFFIEDSDCFVRANGQAEECITESYVDAASDLIALPYSSGTTGLPKGQQ